MSDESIGPDPAAVERRSRLNRVKLRALVRDHLADDSVPEADEFGPGAALRHGAAAWVLLDDRPASRLGAALAWAVRSGCVALDVIAESGTGVLARRATQFSFPVTVWHADGRSLLPAVAEPYPHAAPLPPGHEAFRARIADGGAEPLVEHGVLVGEVRGLEVCRVVDDPHAGTTRLEVGVGAHDREAFQMLHGDVPTADSLARVVAAIAAHRAPGAPGHPLNRLAAERLLRSRVIDTPSLVGATWLEPADPPVPRENLKDAVPCVARGEDAEGGPVVAVFTSGVDLDVVPYAADARLAVANSGVGWGIRLVVVVPARDRLPITDELAGLLAQPVELVSVG